MAIDAQEKRRVEHLLAPFGEPRVRHMFGGAGVWLDEVMIALLAYGDIYWRTDAQTEEAFAAVGAEPFVYTGKSKPIQMPYWRLPASELQDGMKLEKWVETARAAAGRAAALKAKKGSRKQ